MMRWATAGPALLLLAGCDTGQAPAPVPLADNAAMLESAIENRARELDRMADDAADQNAAAAIAEATNAAEVTQPGGGNVMVNPQADRR